MDDTKKSSYKGFTEARAKANKKYLEKFVDIKIRVSPERRTLIQEHASAQNESTSAFINRAIDEVMKRDNG